MKVTIIDCTGWYAKNPARAAANVLVFTKQTRLNMSPDLVKNIGEWSDELINEELSYMANTIPSSWEFVDYTFLIESATRAFTHQFVRTRTASYAQQTMRMLNVDGWTYGTGPSVDSDSEIKKIYDDEMKRINDVYLLLIDMGAKIEDARGILPTNIHTNIVAKMNLRTLTDMFRKRASSRTQGEYRDIIDAMKKSVMEIHPWTSLFFDRTFDRAASELEQMVMKIGIDSVNQNIMIKLIDQMRMTA